MMSASTGSSIRGHHTGAPVAFATGATAPMWSKWQWVRRIASTLAPLASTAARIRSASSPGSTISSRSLPWGRSRKQFSAMGPTVSISTARAIGLLVAAVAHPRSLAPPPHRHVDEVSGGDVEDEHEGAEEERGDELLFEDQDQQHGEDDRREEPAHEGAAPGRRQILLRGRPAAGAGARFRFLAAAGAAGARLVVDPPALGAAALALALLP